MKTIRLIDDKTGNHVYEYKDAETPQHGDKIELPDFRVVTVTEHPRKFTLATHGRCQVVEVKVS